LVPLVAAAAGVLFVSSALTAHGTDLRASRGLQLSQLVMAELRAVTALVGSGDGAVRRLRVATDRLAGSAGLRAAAGPGLRVVLNDAPYRSNLAGLPGHPTADDLVVHQQDLQAVVNALWAGGAKAMAIMGQRVVATTAVRCVGSTLLLQGRVYSPPYAITAVGDPARLRLALASAPDVQIYREYVAAYGLGYRVQTLAQLVVPAYTGPVGT
jgi:uncharacterized protein YlxW (UPF0749 family)